MTTLDGYYIELLQSGFVVMRQAANTGDIDWLQLEIKFLHNIPSLIGEANVGRHRYFWCSERDEYISQMEASGKCAAVSRMRTYYVPILCEMEVHIMQLIGNGHVA